MSAATVDRDVQSDDLLGTTDTGKRVASRHGEAVA